MVSAAVDSASQRCEGGLTSLAGRYNSNQLSPGYASQCRYSHCHLRLESWNIKTRSAEGSIAIWFLEICLKIFVMYLVFWVLFGLVDPVFGTAGLALGIVCLAFEIVYLGSSMVKKEMVFHRYRMWVSLTSNTTTRTSRDVGSTHWVRSEHHCFA